MIAINEELKEIEQKWWLQGDAESVKRSILAQKEQAKSKIEKERYLKALEALVSEKGGKMLDSDIPNLCSGECSLRSKLKGGNPDTEALSQCASNCQFANSIKDKERALRDILHCITFFK